MPSSVIQLMVYDPAGQVLEIVYRDGRGTYRYFGVPPDEWNVFVAAPSKGTYLNEVFKAKKHRYEKVVRGQVERMPQGSLRWPMAKADVEAAKVLQNRGA